MDSRRYIGFLPDIRAGDLGCIFGEICLCAGASSFFLMKYVGLVEIFRIIGTSDMVMAGVEGIASRYHG